ncbi:MAG: chromosomal replication initiator protein DnaA [Patescibacteria group bacterium]|nr:chromosomal replication initiator protein DnaA [Patescibacteria group bacterium]
MNNHEVWQAVLGELELSLSKANFTTWFKNTYISSLEEEKVIISVPNTFTKAWLEKKYNPAILKSLQNVGDARLKEIVYRVDVRPMGRQVIGTTQYQANGSIMTSSQTAVMVDERLNEAKKEYPGDNKLNPKYTFETYVVGKGNELAQAAALAVAQNPGTKYNPLFIYGGVGLGKTHLLQAIGNEVLRRNPATKILYVTCEKFTNDFISAVKANRGKDFKDTYRSIDVLLIDDIQFLTGKEGTQEEFFHTFNALHEGNKQVVLTSDRPPKQIPALEHRLVSRFEWGMTADISTPDLETRIAILETKCRERNYELDSEIIRHIATVVQSNVRELEGALNKVIAFHQFKNIKPSLEGTKQLLTSFGPSQNKKNVTPKHVKQTVATYFDVSIQDIDGACREKRLAFPRQIIMFLMREETRSSYPSIGQEIGGRDHTTAMHAYDKIRRELEENVKLRQDLELIRQRLYNS